MSEKEDVTVIVSRPALTTIDKRQLGAYQPSPAKGAVVRLRSRIEKQLQCSPERLKAVIVRRVPILGWLPSYDFKNYLIGDAVAGLTVAILQIPLGMGFSLLANIPAIAGIYMAFFPVLVYAFFASSRHNSMGAFAVITLMTGKVVNEYATFPEDAAVNSTAVQTAINTTILHPTYTPMEVATTVCFMAGVWSMVLGFLSLGSLTVFFNDMLVSGFSTGAAVHVMVSQLKDVFGIQVQQFSGPFKILYSVRDVIQKLPSSNVATIIISAVSMLILSLNNEQLKPRLAKFTKIPMPIELIVVIIGTTVSYFVHLNQEYDVTIVGEIPTGLPMPAMPAFSLASAVAVDSLVITIVTYAGTISLAKMFATKHDYEVDANQELYATGIGNMVSSFFSCAPMAVAIARVLIQDAAGGMTQMAGLVSAFAILWVLLFIGPVFAFLPKACLASIIIVALKDMLLKVIDMVKMWKISKADAMLWNVTVLAVVLIDVDLGLLVGVLVAISLLVVRGQHPIMARLGHVPDSDLYLDLKYYKKATEVDGIVIVSVDGPLHFANRDNFKENLVKASGINPVQLKKMKDARAKNNDTSSDDEDKQSDRAPFSPLLQHTKFLLLDLKAVNACDAPAANYLARMHRTFNEVNISLCLAAASDKVMKSLEVTGAASTFGEGGIFHTVHDAVTLLKANWSTSPTQDVISKF
ncbi:SLC26A/SulP transporter [Trinorchestia longiramus]|nr:SLC26A/SulP transporter [Trinorchestia longiramus]